MNAILDAALAYAAKGWPVFPCRPASSEELDKNGKPRWKYSAPLIAKGLNAASSDAAQIRRWWKRWPDAMIGLPLGGPTGLFAIDFDPRIDEETGEYFELAALKEATETQIGVPLPQSITAMTPSGGVHLFFRQPDDGGPAIRNKGSLPLHVDVRGEGGYVIAAPSVRFDGVYRWIRGGPDDVAADAPAELIAALREGKPAAGKKESGRATRRAGERQAPAGDVDDAHRRYGLNLLSKLTDELARTHEGARGETLNRVAFALGGAVGAGILSRVVVEHELAAAADRCGLVAKDGADRVDAAIARSVSAGEAQPLDLSNVEVRQPFAGGLWRRTGGPDEIAASAPHPPVDSPSGEEPSRFGSGGDDSGAAGDALDRKCARLPRTDLGNAERFFARHGRDFRFTVNAGWAAWDGRRWEWYHDGAVPAALRRAAMRCVRSIADEADAIEGTEDDFEITVGTGKNERQEFLSTILRRWAIASESKARIDAVVALFQPMVTVRSDIFDQDPMLFNVANGTLAIVERDSGAWEVRLRPHRRADYITKISPVAYDPAARSPVYDAFIARVQPDPEVREFLHRWAGLSLTGQKIQKLVQHYGTGRNGKGTMMEAHSHVAGDYAGTINIESLLAGNVRSGQGSSPDLAKLPGVRLLRVTEPEEGAQLAEAMVKRMTGGDPIDARHNYGPFFTFKPIFKLSFQGNYKLKIRGTDAGIWGRMRLVAWDVTVPDKEQDPELPAKLEAEGPGILNRLLAGLLQYQVHGLAEPAAVTEATQKYRDDSDPVGQFLAMCVRPSPGSRVGSRALHIVYAAWARWTGNVDRAGRPYSEKALTEKLETAKLRRFKSGSMWWLDIELLKAESDFLDLDGNPLPIEEAAPPTERAATASPPTAPSPPVWEDDYDLGRDPWED